MAWFISYQKKTNIHLTLGGTRSISSLTFLKIGNRDVIFAISDNIIDRGGLLLLLWEDILE
jgi:hypothetical protein